MPPILPDAQHFQQPKTHVVPVQNEFLRLLVLWQELLGHDSAWFQRLRGGCVHAQQCRQAIALHRNWSPLRLDKKICRWTLVSIHTVPLCIWLLMVYQDVPNPVSHAANHTTWLKYLFQALGRTQQPVWMPQVVSLSPRYQSFVLCPNFSMFGVVHFSHSILYRCPMSLIFVAEDFAPLFRFLSRTISLWCTAVLPSHLLVATPSSLHPRRPLNC